MKVHVFVIFLFAVVVATMGAPVINDDDEVEAYSEATVQVEGRANRQKRVTCDLIQVLGVGDSACAANCLSMGKAGGHCENTICVCRQTTFMELWNRRFG